MRLMLIAGFLITLPAIVVIVTMLVGGNMLAVFPAAASLGVNSLPFLVAGWFIRKQQQKGGGDTLDAGH
jgi:hypothetical protein